MLPRLVFTILGATLMTSPAAAQVIGPEIFGKTADGQEVESYTLKNANGVTVKIMTLGATITEINVPDKKGKFANVVLGFDDVAGYQSDRNQYFGCTVGRFANRIAKGKFTLEGKEYTLATNNGPNHLHGGVKKSLDKVVWKVAQVEKVTDAKNSRVGIRLAYTSPDGEEGYPGEVKFRVNYFLENAGDLRIEFQATTNKATPINLTNHSYFNLAGAGSPTVLDHELMVNANEYIDVDKSLIPTGKKAVKGTVFDFTKSTRIGERIEKLYGTGAMGYDHCFALSDRQKAPTMAAKLRDPQSGRTLTVWTEKPGVQVYTGNFLNGQKGKDGKTYKQRSAVCLETGGFPDAVNQPAFQHSGIRSLEFT